jgi:copper chaperone CopZ
VEKLTLEVVGMSCGGCARSVERVLAAVPGTSRVSVSLEGARAEIEYDAAQAVPDDFRRAVAAAGFAAR